MNLKQVYNKKVVLLFVLFLVSSTVWGQFNICVGSIHKYGVDVDENGGNGSTASIYTWQVSGDFLGTIIPLTTSGNQIQIDWGATTAGNYVLSVTEDVLGCTRTQSAPIQIRNEIDLDSIPNKYICEIDGSVTLSGEHGFDAYTWLDQNGIIIGNTRQITVDEAGIYTLIVESNDCSATVEVEVLPIEFPTFTINTNQFQTLIVDYHGGNVDVEFQLETLNGTIVRPWQTSNEFYHVNEGLYVVRIRTWDASCNAFVFGSTVNIPNVITPNGDGYNDIWDLSRLKLYAPKARIEIYDRYGKLFKILTEKDNFKWDGKYMGKPLPSTSYVYIIYFDDHHKTVGSLLLKNY